MRLSECVIQLGVDDDNKAIMVNREDLGRWLDEIEDARQAMLELHEYLEDSASGTNPSIEKLMVAVEEQALWKELLKPKGMVL